MEHKNLFFSILLLLCLACVSLAQEKGDEFLISTEKFYTFEFVGHPLRIWAKNGHVYFQKASFFEPQKKRIKKGLQKSGTNRTLIVSGRKADLFYVDDIGLPPKMIKIAVVVKE